MNELCRDCIYFEDKLCSNKLAFCAVAKGPSSECCQEFKPLNGKKPGDRFCVDCAHFEKVLGLFFCDVAYKPGIACPAFRRKSGVAEVTL